MSTEDPAAGGGCAPGGQAEPRFGGFAIGPMRLALPVANLAGVVPLQALLSLPCELPAVIGGLAYQGGVVPVVELHRALGLAEPPPRRACVLLVQEAGRLLGLAVDRPLGLFSRDGSARPRQVGAVQPSGPGWWVGSIEVAGEEGPLLLISLSSLFAEPGLPTAVASAPSEAVVAAGPPELPLLWVRSQGVHLAIEAVAVQDTLPAPALQASPLARGHCRGVLAVQGGWMPVVDLLSLVGLGRAEPGSSSKVVRLQVGGRLLGLLVDEVLDIRAAPASGWAPVPACASAQAGLFAGVLALPCPGGDVESAQTCWVLDAAALVAHEELLALAEVSGAEPMSAVAADTPQDAVQDAVQMLVYEAGASVATPLQQVEEILPALAAGQAVAGPPALLGMVPHRGHGIPVFCLASLIGSPPSAPGGCVLVVPRPDGERIGFAVPRLSFIERASWETRLGGTARQLAGLAGSAQGGELALFDRSHGRPERMVPVVDLATLAGRLGGVGGRSQEVPVA